MDAERNRDGIPQRERQLPDLFQYRRGVPSQRGQPKWAPGWSVQVVNKVTPPRAEFQPDGRHATVDVSGTVQASFNGSGQYVGAQQSGGAAQVARQQFHLVKVNGTWRITNPLPQGRMLTEPDFARSTSRRICTSSTRSRGARARLGVRAGRNLACEPGD